MKPAFGIFVIWSAADHLRSRAMDVLAERFEIRGVHRIRWSPDRVSENYGRFYGSTRLTPPFHTFFEHQKGSGPFTLVTVLDHDPVYEYRRTNRGARVVNARFFDTKQDFRGWTELPKVIHGTETADEAKRDVFMLLGTTPEQYLAEHATKWQGTVQHHTRDVMGAGGWASLEEAFAALNHLVRYVVLRNFEELPASHVVGAHDDVDLLVQDYGEAVRILNARPVLGLVPQWGGRFHVTVAGRRIIFDIRFVGDGYFDRQWQADVLERRQLSENGIYVPNRRDYFETLAYHALAHKRELSSDYSRRLAEMAAAEGYEGWTPERLDEPREARRLLDSLVPGTGRAHVQPKDVTVFYNFAVAGWKRAGVRRKLAGLRRRAAVSWWQLKAPVIRTAMEIRREVVLRLPVLRRWLRPPALN
jgi:hypothetical protein